MLNWWVWWFFSEWNVSTMVDKQHQQPQKVQRWWGKMIMTLNKRVFQEEHILYVLNVNYLSRLPAGFFERSGDNCCMGSLPFVCLFFWSIVWCWGSSETGHINSPFLNRMKCSPKNSPFVFDSKGVVVKRLLKIFY